MVLEIEVDSQREMSPEKVEAAGIASENYLVAPFITTNAAHASTTTSAPQLPPETKKSTPVVIRTPVVSSSTSSTHKPNSPHASSHHAETQVPPMTQVSIFHSRCAKLDSNSTSLVSKDLHRSTTLTLSPRTIASAPNSDAKGDGQMETSDAISIAVSVPSIQTRGLIRESNASAGVTENITRPNESVSQQHTPQAASDCRTARSDTQKPREDSSERSKRYLQDLLEDPSLTPSNQQDFELLWNKRKQKVEVNAERRAKNTFLSWQRNGVSIEAAIDLALKDYGELYEQAHAVRLLFEAEKESWKQCMTDEIPVAKHSRMGELPSYDSGLPRKRPSYFYEQDSSVQDTPQQQWMSYYATEGNSSSTEAPNKETFPAEGRKMESWWGENEPTLYGRSLNEQFQYLTENEIEQQQNSPTTANQDTTPITFRTSLRPQKKFSVPVKK